MSNSLRVVTRQSLRQEAIERRRQRVIRLGEAGHLTRQQTDGALALLERNEIPTARMAQDFNAEQHLQPSSRPGVVAEFTGASAGRFAKGFYTRLNYEVEAGRSEEPLIFPAIYSVTESSDISETEVIYTMSDEDVGVVFLEIQEGGQVQFVSVGGGQKTIVQRHWARGIEYTDRLLRFNKIFRMAPVERAFGRASNALYNHVHMVPILTHSYDPARQVTDGTGLTSFKKEDKLVEKFHLTLEQALTDSRSDEEYRRPGPYILLVSLSNLITVQKALTDVAQRGIQRLSGDVLDNITTVVAYDGWNGRDGNRSASYDGVPTGTAFLIDTSQRMYDFQSLIRLPMTRKSAGGDITRFVEEQVIYHTYFGLYAAPERAVQKILWPGSDDGATGA
jgi:hypothetical protein